METNVIDFVGKDVQLRSRQNLQSFQKFVNALCRPVVITDDCIMASMTMLCYRNRKISSYIGEVMLVTHGHGRGVVRIADGGIDLISEDVFHLLESPDRIYDLDRAGRALIIEADSLVEGAAHRIELHEYLG